MTDDKIHCHCFFLGMQIHSLLKAVHSKLYGSELRGSDLSIITVPGKFPSSSTSLKILINLIFVFVFDCL